MVSIALAWVLVTAIKEKAKIDADPVSFFITGVIDGITLLGALAIITGRI